MLVTKEKLIELNACEEGIEFLEDHNMLGEPLTDVIKFGIAHEQYDYCNWLIIRFMDYKQRVSYAVFAAEQCIENYETSYPDDDRPRQAIEAAKICIENPSAENKEAAKSAAWSAESAAWSAWSASESARTAWSASESAALSAAESAAETAADTAARSAWSAARSAWSAWSASESAALSSRSASRSAARSAESAADLARSAESAAYNKILNYGLSLLGEE
jgi:hypothetical protein